MKYKLLAALWVFAAPFALASEGAKLPMDFEVTIKAGKIHEQCVELKQGAEVTYRFKASQPVPFNIHYHVGNGKDEKVEYPVKIDKIDAKDEVFRAPLDQHYCWMWSNKTDGVVSVNGHLR